jgi:S-(hydroxymethyl)glutathione dehydrogenase / alcohol dehydrogenase
VTRQRIQAAVLRKAGNPLSIETIEIDAPAPHEVLIRTVAVGLCHSDLHFIDGTYPHALPLVPGHEAAGIVEAVGSEVRTVRVGDAVVTCLSAFCGHCEFCVTGKMSLCLGAETRRAKGAPPRLCIAEDGSAVAQLLNLSAFAQKMLVHEHACVAINPDMPMEAAAMLGCAVTTGAGAIFHACDVHPGEDVAVIGCGGVGLATINAARIAGAGRIIAADPVPQKRALALAVGATDVVDAMAEDAAAQIISISNGGVHHAIEAVGRAASAQLATDVLRRGGTATILGMMPPGERIGLGAMDLLSGKKLQGALMGSNRFPVDIPRLVDFYLRGVLHLDAMIAKRISLSEINTGFDAMRSGETARHIIIF